MSVLFDDISKTFTLTTAHTTYQMGLAGTGHLLHLYYGARAEGRFDYLCRPRDCGFSPNPYELREDRTWSLDTKPQEYSGANCGDYRLSSVLPVTAKGTWGADLRYVGHEIRPGKYDLNGLPAAFDPGQEAETLSITLTDTATGLTVELLYGVYEGRDVIARTARLTNGGSEPLVLEKAASLCLDLPFGDWELISFSGRHCMERQPRREALGPGIRTVSSKRGMSSHQSNPFLILCSPQTTEDFGECLGVMPVYSGNHRTDLEVDQMGSLRVVSGIHDELFSWTLGPGQSFETPEVLLTFTSRGLTALSQTYHRFLRQCLCRSPFSQSPRPVLLNSWEAAYFDFDADRLLSIARGAKELGVELFVLDDGWFGQRNDDNRGLGDWFANREKLPGGLSPLIEKINALGLKFGIWIEPEMVNQDSDLFRAHPDWALTVPDRPPTLGRNQLVLDLSRPAVVDYLYDTFSALLRENPIRYVKWDMNRGLTDLYSHGLPPDRQGEVAHRYVLGVYDLLRRLTGEFPQVLFEGCAGGGGRFDAGILAYCPQIWCSDNTDAVDRLDIQRGTSYGYPLSAMGAHVSACPNHQTGRTVPLETRALVAMSGTFGYELDPAALSPEEKAAVREQLRRFRDCEALVRNGDYYRLPGQPGRFTAWQLVSEDRGEALVSLVVTRAQANPRPLHIRLKGLEPEARYEVRRELFGRTDETGGDTLICGGAALMFAGYTFPALLGDYPCARLVLRRL